MSAALIEKQKEEIFNEDIIHDLVDDYFIETNEDGEARLTTLSQDRIFIQVMDIDRIEGTRTISTFVFPESKELYLQMDKSFRNAVKLNYTTDFKEMWNALMSVLDPEFLLAREIFEV